MGYLEEKTGVACSPSGCVEATAPGQEARPLSSPASSWPGHLFRFPGPQLLYVLNRVQKPFVESSQVTLTITQVRNHELIQMVNNLLTLVFGICS